MLAALAPEKEGRSRKVKHPVDVCSEQTKWGGPLASDACLFLYIMLVLNYYYATGSLIIFRYRNLGTDSFSELLHMADDADFLSGTFVEFLEGFDYGIEIIFAQ